MPYRTKEFDYDTRRQPKTKDYCAMCQRDMKPNSPRRYVHLVGHGALVLHPADEDLYDEPQKGDDAGGHYIGLDCARKLGLEWTTP